MTFSSIALSTTTCTVVDLLDDWDQWHEAWDRFVDQHPKGSIFHLSSMIRACHAARGHNVLPLAAVNDMGEITALLVAVRVQTLPDPFGRVSSRSIFYAEPLCHDDSGSIDALSKLIARHDKHVGGRVLFSEVRPLLAPGPERSALELCGYEFQEYLNYVVDLSPPLEELWTKLRKSARRGVRQCEKRDFHIRELDTPDSIEQLYQFLKGTYRNARVPLADQSLFDAAFTELHPRGLLKLIATYDGDRPVAMDSLLNYKGRSFAWYGGLERITGVSPFDYLQWYELAWAKEHGFELYDFGGAGWPNEPYGVREYKAKFGGELVCYGRYRKVYSPWKFRLAERAYEFGRTVIAPK
jgi:CelD/BcsL family acetyltransferase involved in cellulose biosynthesis